MKKIIIKGGNKLKGEVVISGAKNAALPILAATVLAKGVFTIKNVPKLRDINSMLDMLKFLGATCEFVGENELLINTEKVTGKQIPYEMVKQMRASICFLGPMLARFSECEISMPGGCVIGPRPIDLHIKGLSALGVESEIIHGYVKSDASKMVSGDVFLGGRFGSSVLATANLMMASVFLEGKTVIESAACEPEITDLADFLNAMGAEITGAGSPTVTIEGVKELSGVEYTVIPDRIETGTFIVAAAATGGEILIKNANLKHLSAVVDVLTTAGVHIEKKGADIFVKAAKKYVPVDAVTLPYPGFPTDMQAQLMSLMAVTNGLSIITEKVYPERFMHVSELNRLGCDIKLEGPNAIVKGVDKLSGAPVQASDLRASAALVIAGLAAEGTTEIHRVYHIDRGYERIEEKLNKLGADITRADD